MNHRPFRPLHLKFHSKLRSHALSKALVVFVFAVSMQWSATCRAAGLTLQPSVMVALNHVLGAGDALHKSLVELNEDQIEMGIRDLINQLDQAKTAASVLKPHDRGHLLLVLDAAREQFEQTQTAYGEERVSRLLDGFNQLANLVRVYQVDRSYGIFFCPDDKSSWVQKGFRGQNPFHPKTMLNCGIRVVNR